jgi:hypothetical protein
LCLFKKLKNGKGKNSRERSSSATAPKHSKRQNKHHDLRPTIQRRRHNIVVLDEELRTISPEVELREEAESEKHGNGGIDPHKQVAHLPEDDGGVDVAEGGVRVIAVDEPEGHRDDEADEIGDRDPLVFGADGEGVAGDAPGDGEGVELLNVLAGPDVRAGEAFEDGGLVVDDSGYGLDSVWGETREGWIELTRSSSPSLEWRRQCIQ